MKKTFSLTVDCATYHLISYYNPADVISGMLRTPSAIPHIASLPIGPEFTADESQFRQPPTEPRVEELSSSTSESNKPNGRSSHAGPSSDRYLLSPVSSVAHSPTLSPSPSQWTSTYASQNEEGEYAYQLPDGRLHDNQYGHAPAYAAYASNGHRYEPSSSRPHTSGHDRRNEYHLTQTVWPHTPSDRPDRSSSRSAYEYPSDNETFQS